MTTIQIEVDTNSPSSIAGAKALLDRLHLPVSPVAELAPARDTVQREVDLPERIREMLTDAHYGANRRAYVRSVASDPHGASHEMVKRAVAAADPDSPGKDLGRSVGGTHSSIEACWKAAHLPEGIWQGHHLPAQWIEYSRDRREHTMDPAVAEVTLQVLDEIESGLTTSELG